MRVRRLFCGPLSIKEGGSSGKLHSKRKNHRSNMARDKKNQKRRLATSPSKPPKKAAKEKENEEKAKEKPKRGRPPKPKADSKPRARQTSRAPTTTKMSAAGGMSLDPGHPGEAGEEEKLDRESPPASPKTTPPPPKATPAVGETKESTPADDCSLDTEATVQVMENLLQSRTVVGKRRWSSS